MANESLKESILRGLNTAMSAAKNMPDVATGEVAAQAYYSKRPLFCSGALLFRPGEKQRRRGVCSGDASAVTGLCEGCTQAELRWREELEDDARGKQAGANQYRGRNDL